MTTVDEVIESEIERVARWRVEELMRAGYVWGALTRFRVWDAHVGRRVVRPSR